ncbi:MAG: response regulator [Deltaproteobacteria bacterium]|nr:response regulator [Deltaproteobacteria bacterium]
MTELRFLFGAVGDERAGDVAAFLAALPHLCQGSLAECDLGVRSSGDLCACVVHLREPVPAAVLARLAFWAWRTGGSLTLPADGSPPGLRADTAEAVLRCCDTVLQHVAPEALAAAAPRLLGELGGALPRPEPLALRVALGPDGAAGLAFDRRKAALFVPSPLSPPAGDEVVLALGQQDGEVLRTEGVVAALRAAGEEGPGSPAGYVLGLIDPTEAVLEALDRCAGPLSAASRRSAPRYTVRARARVSVRARTDMLEEAPTTVARLTYARPADFVDDYVENLSQGGAFVRTTENLPPGTPVRLDLELPGGATVAVPGVVAYRTPRGVGVRFELDDAGEAAIADALVRVTTRRRRALIVDDDLLARRMLGDALAGHGFEVFAAADGKDGLRVLTDELLDLDLLVTDLRMPAVDGEMLLDLIRGLGGEKDLAVVVVSGHVDASVTKRLLAAGADAVLAKGEGVDAVADAAVGVVLRRARADGLPGAGLQRSA